MQDLYSMRRGFGGPHWNLLLTLKQARLLPSLVLLFCLIYQGWVFRCQDHV